MNIKYRDLKDKIRQGLKDNGLYYLETVFKKECSGHGVGFGEEDISFEYPGKDVSIYDNGRRLKIQTYKLFPPELDIDDPIKLQTPKYITSKLLK